MTQSFTNTHRYFLQACLVQRFIKESEALSLLRRACEITQEPFDESLLAEVISTLNEGINSLDLEFRKSHDEETGEMVLALVNTNGDEIAQLATDYTPTELVYLRRIIELIITADDESYSVSSLLALSESSKLKSAFTKNAAEQLLDRFVNDKWISKTSHGRYFLTQRSILELQTYLKEEFEEYIQECTLCMDIITRGERCHVANCSGRLHLHCADRYFSSRPDRKVCPLCSTAWTSTQKVGPSNPHHSQ
ncbi:hypothetical protein K7432_001605 [Basidiobolus ranarum]|uniref:Non-structural maintenance of chromosomes element 1 homolog n=1 Tax=Basidiobolus ranarum TaxID=34480 RepID=A0ABR2X2T0_9FUNG